MPISANVKSRSPDRRPSIVWNNDGVRGWPQRGQRPCASVTFPSEAKTGSSSLQSGNEATRAGRDRSRHGLGPRSGEPVRAGRRPGSSLRSHARVSTGSIGVVRGAVVLAGVADQVTLMVGAVEDESLAGDGLEPVQVFDRLLDLDSGDDRRGRGRGRHLALLHLVAGARAQLRRASSIFQSFSPMVHS